MKNKYNKNNLNTKTIASCAWMCNSGEVTVLWVVLMIGVPRRRLGPRDNRAGTGRWGQWGVRGPPQSGGTGDRAGVLRLRCLGKATSEGWQW